MVKWGTKSALAEREGTLFYRVSEKSGTNGNFNYFLMFIYRLKLKVKRLKMVLTSDERVEIMRLSGRQGWCMLLKSEIFFTLGRELQALCYCRSQYVEQNPHKHGKAAEKMR
jgi:hypothetical protein